MSRPRVAIIGAGPIGIEAALYATLRGFRVDVLEARTVGSALSSWGHVRLFSPFDINSSIWGREALAAFELPERHALLTGREHLERYLAPLSRLSCLTDCIHENRRVVAISRDGLWKSDQIGSQSRRESPFQLLVEDNFTGREETVNADVVLDCSGTFPNHNSLGAGGIPCPGERTCKELIDYRLPDIPGKDRPRFEGMSTLVVGGGFSAATSIAALADLHAQNANTTAIWITRISNTVPLAEIVDDPLSERAALTHAANSAATEQGGGVDWRPSSLIRSLDRAPDGRLEVSIERRTILERLTVDRIIANVGYRPDRSIYEELQVHECYATQGPIRLAAALLGESSGDCLEQSTPTAETLLNPEPGFFILGSKSYGRDSRFLLRIGIEQIESAFSLIEEDST